MNHYGVIMAGGGGTRFWPLSRQNMPKQLLNLSGKNLMINEAVDRMASVIRKSNIFIITSDSQMASMIEATAGRVFPNNILAEPVARNTAACIGYSAMKIIRKYGDGIMVITPSDHYVEKTDCLTDLLKTAISTAEEKNKLVTIGLKPTFPSTGFGYIRYDNAEESSVKQVLEFKEKPDEDTARAYVASGEYAWNSGMFIWKASLILEKLKEYVPDIFEDLKTIGDSMNTPFEQEILHTVYPKIRKTSIDYAVMEPSASKGDVLVIPGDCGWNDVGSWDMMTVLHKPDSEGNVFIGDTVTTEVRDSIIYSSGRMVAAIGIENLVIVEMPDAVLVCSKDKAQDVKRIVEMLNDRKRNELL